MATTAQLDAKNKKIIITDGKVIGQIDIANQIISMDDGAGSTASLALDNLKIQISNEAGGIELSLAEQHIVIYKSDGTTASIALADLIAATLAQFQDVTFVSSVNLTGGVANYRTKTMRVFCVAPSDESADIPFITFSKYNQTGGGCS